MTRLEQALALAVLIGPCLCCIPLARQRRPGARSVFLAAATILVTLTWFLHKAPYEGPAIIALSPTRGLTVVDLVVPGAFSVCAAVVWRWWAGRLRGVDGPVNDG